VESSPELVLGIDLGSLTVTAGDLRVPFTIKPGAREALTNGTWDPIGQLLDGAQEVQALTERLAYLGFQPGASGNPPA
ncbi:MAG TPA: hypothetical protein VER33_10020, partial [Polyangiaceae bacterium]|nr:hypothetical protein [Polyangiaceae bacterium]